MQADLLYQLYSINYCHEPPTVTTDVLYCFFNTSPTTYNIVIIIKVIKTRAHFANPRHSGFGFANWTPIDSNLFQDL